MRQWVPRDRGEPGIHGQRAGVRRPPPRDRGPELGQACSRAVAVANPEGDSGQDRALVWMDHADHPGDCLPCQVAGFGELAGEERRPGPRQPQFGDHLAVRRGPQRLEAIDHIECAFVPLQRANGGRARRQEHQVRFRHALLFEVG